MTRWLFRMSLLVVLVFVTTACDWTTFGFLSSGGRNNFSETAIGVGNVAGLTAAWTASGNFTSSPTVAGGLVYVTGDAGRLEAFDATGTSGCSGDPRTCTPLWTATIGSAGSAPTVSSGVLYVGSSDGTLSAFDATGNTGCSGTPKVCTPRWTASTGGTIASSPVVLDAVVYVGSFDGKLYAFDRLGAQGCSGTPKTCAPLWTAAAGGSISSSPAVFGGRVYVAADASFNALSVFDASGSTGCTGTPKTCTPLWTGTARGIYGSSPAVVGGVVYVGSDADRSLFAFDAAGSVGCQGTPRYCVPLWSAPTTLHIDSSPAVANGKVYVAGRGSNVLGTTVLAFDATGATHCSGDPKTCTPVWINGEGDFLAMSSPAVANGVVYNNSPDGNAYAFDATTGEQLWSAPVGTVFAQSPAIANGVLYVTSGTGLTAFKP